MKNMLHMSNIKRLAGASALLAALFAFAAHAQANPRIVPLVTSADAEISGDKRYTHAVIFGANGTPVNILGVNFIRTTAGASGNMGAPNTAQAWTGFPNTGYFFNTPNLNSGEAIYPLFAYFLYPGGNEQNHTVTISGLKPRAAYEFSLYMSYYEAKVLDFTFFVDGVPHDGAPLRYTEVSGGRDQRIVYHYRASSTGTLVMQSKWVSGGAANRGMFAWAFTNELLDDNFELLPPNVTPYSATLGAKYLGAATAVSTNVFWGFSDGGTNSAETAFAAWQGPAPATDAGGGVCSATTAQLVPGSTYFYRFVVETSGGEFLWSALSVFKTPPTHPLVEMVSAAVDAAGSASVFANLTHAGATAPGSDLSSANLTLYWAPDDFGTSQAAWESGKIGSMTLENRNVGPHEFAFAAPKENTAYHCRVFAQNPAGLTASPTGLRFLWATMTADGAGTLWWGGGSADIPPLTPTAANAGAAGVWNAGAKNWAVDAEGSQYVSWLNGGRASPRAAVFPAGGNAAVKLAAPVTLNRATVNATTTLSADTPLGVTLAGAKPELDTAANAILTFNANVSLVAPDGFEKSGAGNLDIYSRNPNAQKTVSIRGGALRVQDTGALEGAKEIIVREASNLQVYLASGANTKLADTATVRLHASRWWNWNEWNPAVFYPRGNTGGTETLGQLFLEGGGFVYLESAYGKHTLSGNPGIVRGLDNTAALVLQSDANDFLHSNLVVNAGTGPDKINTGVLLPWAHTHRARPVMLDPVEKIFVAMPTDDAPPNDLRGWVDGKHYRLVTGFTPANTITNSAITSLGSIVGTTVTIADNNTLDITSGQLALCSPLNINGGKLTTSSGRLHASGAGRGNVHIKSEITGPIDFVKSGQYHLNFSGGTTNTYTGVTYVNGYPLNCEKDAPQAAFSGDVVINRGGLLRAVSPFSNNYPTNVNYLVREGGVLNTRDSASQWFNGVLTFENGSLLFGGGSGGLYFTHPGKPGIVFKNGGTFQGGNHPQIVLTDILCEAASSNQVRFLSSNADIRKSIQAMPLSLEKPNGSVFPPPGDPSRRRVFEVNKAVGLAPGLADMVNDMHISVPAPWWGASEMDFVKTGGGVMSMGALSGTFRGTVTIEGGTILLNALAEARTVLAVSEGSTKYHLEGGVTDGLWVTQPFTYTRTNDGWRTTGSLQQLDTTSTNLWFGLWNAAGEVAIMEFQACGSLGKAPVTVCGTATLGGVGGAGGSVLVKSGGALSPGTLTQPVGNFRIDGNLEFKPGALWRVDVDATGGQCDHVSVGGNLTLAGEVVLGYPGVKRPKGVFTIATYAGAVAGKMTAPQGCRVLVNETAKTVELHSNESGTLFLVR